MLEGGFTTGGPEDIELKKGICSNYLFIYFFSSLQPTLALNSYYEAGVNLLASKQVVSSNLGVFLLVSSLSSGFLQKAKDMQVSLIGHS